MTALAAASRQEGLASQLAQGLAALGLDLSREAQERMLHHLQLLEKWNRVHNLTAIRQGEKAVSVHLLDSLAVLPYLSGSRFLDAGSGAGFPGIPVAIARPEAQVDLLDSNHKKCAFLRQAVAELGLKNARVVCERVESWRPARQFDCILSRALAEMAEVIALVEHLLAPGGIIVAMKGLHPFEEIGRVPAGFRVREVHAVAVPGLGAERHLVLVERA
ncbi:MAG TPA: 16S rRNA (guanine(527)-N(7))-methyltransferase RsmG [Burkholderiales bacterium]|nr:16S rRNA (guanine(527)-N(7))-methyltransferase RsmG [Burkholderiales bacterium]